MGKSDPHLDRWPSSDAAKGFKAVSDAVHELGLKFGIQVVAGIHKLAVDRNKQILDTKTGGAYQENGRVLHANDILTGTACSYSPNFLVVDSTSNGGKAFLRSVYEQCASWGVDFVKLDCVFGDHLNMGEIRTVSEILQGLNRKIIFSVSPGVAATPEMGRQASEMVNMYRVTPNNWDQWQILVNHFEVARNFAQSRLLGTAGLNGNAWPDLDILPFGWLTDPDSTEGPHRKSKLTMTEQETEMTLWSMAKSPLMFGGDMKKLDFKTQQLLSNPTLLEINSYSVGNKEIPNSFGPGIRTWLARGRKGEIYVAIFNLNEKVANTKMDISYIREMLPVKGNFSTCTGSDLWSPVNEVANGTLLANVEAHACALFTLTCQ
ncbi:alpha-galactosidase-like [Prosopis cineraria]|uniref:alpha-galactosidase-like n=1 Tax=Prosopis cineraria TaxID=364024 RepID=UPI00240FAE37|nr:alpha-galactosidase-like [Prosopis cineraria]